MLSGSLLAFPVSLLVTARPSCSTSLGAAASRARGGSTATVGLGLYFKKRVVGLIYMHPHHLMVIISVSHGQINLVTISV